MYCLGFLRQIAVFGFLLAGLAWAQTNEEVFREYQFNFNLPGARANAMGGAFIGLADDATSSFTNPAGLAFLKETALTFEYRHRSLDAVTGTVMGQVNTEFLQGEELLDGPAFFSVNLHHRGWFFGLFQYDYLNVRQDRDFRVRLFSDGEQRIEIRDIALDLEGNTLGVGVARRFGKWKVGATLNNLSFSANTLNQRLGVVVSRDPEEIRFQSEISDRDRAWGYSIGLLHEPGTNFSWGVVWRVNPKFSLGGSAFEEVNGEPVFIDEPQVPFVVPDVFGSGMRYKVRPSLSILLDWQRIFYSQIIEDGFVVVENITTDQKENYLIEDTDEFHFGFEWLLARKNKVWAFRGGYYRNPLHTVSYVGNDPTIRDRFAVTSRRDEDHFTMGVGWVFRNVIEIDLSLNQWEAGKEVTASFIWRKKMIFLFFLLLLPQQLTWYEVYERGEKQFRRSDFRACIADMDEALEGNATPKAKAFTRAVQTIEYKPFYYKALSYFELGELPEAYENAQRAWEADVVSESPKLQADLAKIFENYREMVQELSQQYDLRQAQTAKRRQVLKLLEEGKIGEASALLDELSQQEGFEGLEDLQDQVKLSRKIQDRDAVINQQMMAKILQWLDMGERVNAQALFEFGRDNMQPDMIAEVERRFAELPEIPVEQVVADEPPTVVEGNAEINSFLQQLTEIRLEKNEVEKQNREMNLRLQELEREVARKPVQNPPELVLHLTRAGFRTLGIQGSVVSPLNIRNWNLSLNGVAFSFPAHRLQTKGSTTEFETSLEIRNYGPQQVVLKVVDGLGREAIAQKPLFMPLPWFLNMKYWYGLLALLALGLIYLALMGLRRRKRARLLHFNPYIAGSPVRTGGMFFGRDALIRRIQGLVHKNSFMIHGTRRIGKTSLLLQLQKNLKEIDSQDYLFYPVFIDLQGVTEPELFHFMMHELLAQASSWPLDAAELSFSETNQGYLSRHFSRDMRHVINGLQEGESRHVMVVLLVDEVDVLNEFGEKTNQKLRGIFMKDYAEHLTCVMAGIHLKKEWESSGSPWYNFFEEIPVNAIEESSARKLILEPVRGIFKYQPAAVDLIFNATGGHPYLIQKVCVSLIGEKLNANRFRITRPDVETVLKKMNEEIQRNQHELYY